MRPFYSASSRSIFWGLSIASRHALPTNARWKRAARKRLNSA
jgi:hypothetical protein